MQMIHPNMATMLAVLTTDAKVAPSVLREALVYAASRSFNAVSIDGDTSTNDTLAVLANGKHPSLENQASMYCMCIRPWWCCAVYVCIDTFPLRYRATP